MINLPDFEETIFSASSEEEVRTYRDFCRDFKRLKKNYSSKALLELAGLLIEEVRHRDYEKYFDTPRPATRPVRGVVDLPDF